MKQMEIASDDSQSQPSDASDASASGGYDTPHLSSDDDKAARIASFGLDVGTLRQQVYDWVHNPCTTAFMDTTVPKKPVLLRPLVVFFYLLRNTDVTGNNQLQKHETAMAFLLRIIATEPQLNKGSGKRTRLYQLRALGRWVVAQADALKQSPEVVVAGLELPSARQLHNFKPPLLSLPSDRGASLTLDASPSCIAVPRKRHRGRVSIEWNKY